MLQENCLPVPSIEIESFRLMLFQIRKIVLMEGI
jgi:hypothetical protein